MEPLTTLILQDHFLLRLLPSCLHRTGQSNLSSRTTPFTSPFMCTQNWTVYSVIKDHPLYFSLHVYKELDSLICHQGPLILLLPSCLHRTGQSNLSSRTTPFTSSFMFTQNWTVYSVIKDHSSYFSLHVYTELDSLICHQGPPLLLLPSCLHRTGQSNLSSRTTPFVRLLLLDCGIV